MGARVLHLAVESVRLAKAVAAFLVQRDLAAGSRRKYRGTRRQLCEDLGAARAVAEIARAGAGGLFTTRWVGAAPST